MEEKLDWGDKNTYEYVIYKNDKKSNIIENALEIVRDFSKRNDMILVGGMSIDFALKQKGDKLYSDNVIPDYDYVSYKSYELSVKLGNILFKQGFPNISVIPAMHIQTIRVRVDFTVVADITYLPDKVYKKIPYFEYDGMKVIDPNYQRMDILSSISYPLLNIPREAYLQRMSKDINRLNLLDRYYTIGGTYPSKKNMNVIEVNISEWKNSVFSGFIGYALWVKFSKNKPKFVPRCDIIDDILHVGVPKYMVDIYQENFYMEEKHEKYRQFLFLPMCYKFVKKSVKYTVYDSYDTKFVIQKFDRLMVSSIQHLMFFFLIKHFQEFNTPFRGDYEKDINIQYYNAIIDLYQSNDKNASYELYGSSNRSDRDKHYINDYESRLVNGKKLKGDVPEPVYHESGFKDELSFDYERSEYFLNDGRVM